MVCFCPKMFNIGHPDANGGHFKEQFEREYAI